MKTQFEDMKNLLIKLLQEVSIKTVRSVGIYGSFSRKDEIQGWSDFDVMIFCFGDKLSTKNMLILRKINIELTQKYPDIPVTFRVHSEDEFPQYKIYEGSICSYSLFSYMKDLIFIFGENLSSQMEERLKEITISQVIDDLRSKIISSRHESRSIITSSNSIQPFTQSFHIKINIIGEPKRYTLARYIDYILECALVCNILKGRFNGKKISTAKDFQELFPDYKFANLPMKVAKIRSMWETKNEPKLEQNFIEDAFNFFETILDLFDQSAIYNQVNNSFEGLLINDDPKLKYRNNSCGIIINNTGKFLIVQKHSGSWGFIQGGKEDSDLTSEDTISREIIEELGLEQQDIKIEQKLNLFNLYDWSVELQKREGFKGQVQTFFLVKITNTDKIKIDSKELSAYKWINFEDYPNFLKNKNYMKILSDFKEEYGHLINN